MKAGIKKRARLLITSNRKATKEKQDGLVLLVLVIVIFLGISTYYFSTISLVEVQVDKIGNTQAVLKRAKQALLAYARVNWQLSGKAGKIGKLPCPDYIISGTEGEQDGSCGNAYANAIGYFPWRTLDIEVTKDSSGSCLLYAVSPAYKTSPTAALNPDSFGQFRVVDRAGVTLQGVSPEDRPVAVIIAPGAVLPGQIRENNPPTICGSYYSDDVPDLVSNLVAAYLDNDGNTNNAAIDPGTDNVIENVVQKYAGSDKGNNPLNDRLVTITHKELWASMQSTIRSPAFRSKMKNLTEAVALCFAGYGNDNGNHLPMPALLDLSGGDYRRDSDYDDSNIFTAGFSGRLPYSVEKANTKLDNSNLITNIFSYPYCDGLELTTTTANPDNIHFTDDLGGDKGAFLDLWRNWKDHFFYAISKAHNPSAGSVAACSGDCLSVNGVEYAGIVF
ncbi:MAG TPA: hypothetical protein ENJ87_03355, partial [Gammaproteobacteria bacterium]|nr:hypothetical protein [Gammaproteobacteria bacterium]